MDINEFVKTLRRYGLTNSGSLGRHMGIMDEAANLIESLKAQLVESQHREKAAIRELNDAAPCFACLNFKRNSGICFGAGRCRYAEPEFSRYPHGFEWRGQQEDMT